MKNNFLLVLISLVLGCIWTFNATLSILYYFQYSEPTVLTCSELIEKGTKAKWVTLKECYSSFEESMYIEDQNGTVGEIFIPVYDFNDGKNTIIPMVIHSKKIGKYPFLNELKKLDGTEEENYVNENMLKIALAATSDITGTLESSIKLTSNEKDKFTKLGELTSPYFVIREGEKPSLNDNILLLILGITAFVYSGKNIRDDFLIEKKKRF